MTLFKKYTLFFSASTHRWEILNSHLQPNQHNVKQLSNTRWSAKADAVSALREACSEIKEAFIKISEYETEKPLAKTEAKSFTRKFNEYKTAFMTVLWDRLLQRINKVSKCLQKEDGNMKLAVELLESLKLFFVDVRNDYLGIDMEACTLSASVDQPDDDESNKRRRKRKSFGDERLDDEVHLEGKEKI